MTNEQQRLEQEIAKLTAAIDLLAGVPDSQQPLLAQREEKQRALAQLRQPAASSVHADRDAIIATHVTVHNYGPAAPDVRHALHAYLRTLKGECNRLSLADSDSSDPTRAAAELAAVYTALETATSVEVARKEGQNRSQERRQLTALEALSQHARLVILGAPGSGKSTLLNYVGLCLAETQLGEADGLAKLGAEWTHGALLPIRAVLRELASWLSTLKERPKKGSAELFWRWLAAQASLIPALISFFQQQLDQGRVLLLLDGLDEVPGDQLALVLGIVRELANTAGTSRVVVSCRVLDYQQRNRQLAGWPTETIIAFSPELQAAFIQRWFELLAHLKRPLNGSPAELRDRLQREVRARPELRRLSGNPLLLTMMTLVHAYEGRLPDERVLLYEKCVEMLVHSWRKEQKGWEQPLREQLGIESWSESDLGRLLDRLGYAAHLRGVSSDGETGADLPRLLLIEEARQFFEGYDTIHDAARAQTFCNYIAQYSNGVLQLHDQQIFRFPHRTFQEYLAARRLVSDGDWPEGLTEFSARALQAADAGPQWREALLLAVSRQAVVLQQVSPAALLVEDLLERHPQPSPAWARDVILAGELLAEVGRERLSRLGPRRAALWERTVQGLLTILEHLDQQRQAIVPTTERIRAAQALGLLGDPRFPATIAEWRRELGQRNQDFGKPAGYFCYVPAGTYMIGGWNEGEKSAELQLPAFWIARLPVTVAQFTLFASVGYREEAQYWWTEQGWSWKAKNNRTEPFYVDIPQFSQPNQPAVFITWYEATAFCAWLTEMLREHLPEGAIIRLPTEAEWEAAASWDGQQRQPYPWGSDELTSELAIYDALQLDAPASAGCCPAGVATCGALELAGNVWEWTSSAHGAYPHGAAKLKKDFTPNEWDVPRRGGSYWDSSTFVHCGARNWNYPDLNSVIGGFRIVVASPLARLC